ncbi:6640_t:CDS:1 [Funneliformis mosseae]|uniref:6640_t:CDS:1 n=1 Tax=Funneliformis mosseae TaxID=27381 RepID=A0A9N8VRP3_FUNMO|nr:6640_t:CDS:1 [Funneliformis mosseae]
MTEIIKNSGGQLRRILIDKYDCSYEDSLTLMRRICEKCPLLEYLSLAFSSTEEYFVEFERLLKFCQRLKSLLLLYKASANERDEPYLYYENYCDSGKRLSEVLLKSAPNELREIRFDKYGFRFSFDTFKSFLENWRGRASLSIVTSDFLYNKEEYMSVVEKYKDEGVIKDFKYGIIYFSVN